MPILPLQLARVSNQLRTDVAQSTLARRQQELLRVQNELITGKRINTVSDDPGDAAVVQQLQKTLETRESFGRNLQHAQNHLSEVDSALGDLTDILEQAKTIASANLGSDVTPSQRTGAAGVIQQIYSQALSLGNHQFEGSYLFGGDRATDAPFVVDNGGVRFTATGNTLQNQYDEQTTLPFEVAGDTVFGGLSQPTGPGANLRPGVTAQTRVADLAGATNDGVRLGTIAIGNGTATATVDLSGADTLGDITDAINAAGLAGVTASVAPGGAGLRLSASGGANITVQESGGPTAADLGIFTASAAGANVNVDGANLGARLTILTPLSALNSGAGIDTTGFLITNGDKSATIDLTSAATVGDLINAVNGSGTGAQAAINNDGNGVQFFNPIQGTKLTIAENGGTTVTDLGVRSLSPSTSLTSLTGNKGITRNEAGVADFRVGRRDGTAFDVDLSAATNVQDVINLINAADAGGGVTAGFATTGNGITLTDSTGGAGTLTITDMDFSTAARDLGLLAAPAGAAGDPNFLQGSDVGPVETQGIFASLARLRDALQRNDQSEITAASADLEEDSMRVTRVRGQTGARVQELEARGERLEDQNVATTALLSSIEDTDFSSAVSRFQTLQTSLQAALQTTGTILNQSLLDFLG